MKKETTKKKQTRKKVQEAAPDVTMWQPSAEPAEQQYAEKDSSVPEENPVEPVSEKQQAAHTEMVVKPKTDGVFKVKNKVPEEDTAEMLRYLGIGLLPELDKNLFWTRAAAKVLKRNGTVSWCVLKKDGMSSHKIEKVFGTCSPILLVGTIVPVEGIPGDFLNDIAGQSADKKRDMAKRMLIARKMDDDVSKMSETELENIIFTLEKKRYEEFKERRESLE